MRNLKRALSLTLASVMLLGMMVIGTSAASYPDVDKDNNVEAIEVLQAVGVMQGDDKGNFDPNRSVSRNEMAIVMAKLLNLDYNYYSESCPFWDVPDYAKPYVGACYANGIVSGYNATQYGGADTVTAVQAASMMMRALGYFQYESDYKEGFVIATVKQASKIGLFKDINANQDSPLTRDQVAQLALNTLKTGMVEAQKNNADITIGSGDTAVTINGAVTYVYVTSGDTKFNSAIDNIGATSLGQFNDGLIVELGEKLYNGDLKLVKDDTDDFGRPSQTWTYKNDKVGTYANKGELIASYDKKVSKGDLYSLLSSAVRSDLENTAEGSAKLTVTVNGGYTNGKAAGNTNADASSWYVRNSSEAIYTPVADSTRRGTLTEVYLDKDNNVDIAIIDTFVYQATSDYSSSRDDVRMAPAGDTVLALKGGELTLKGEDFNIQDVKTDDYLLITAASATGSAYEVQSVQVAEKVTGEVTGYTANDSVTIDGTTYNYSATALKSAGGVRTTAYTVGQDAVVVLDNYGNIIAVDEAVSSNSFVFIKDFGSTSGLTTKVLADAYFTDGTNEEITIDRVDNEKSASVLLNGAVSGKKAINKWYTYSVNSDGKYVLYTPSNRTNGNQPYTASGDTKIVINGKVDFLAAPGTAIANDKTIMLVKDNEGDMNVYTGTANIPDVNLPDTKTATVYYLNGSKGYAEYVFVDLENTGSSVVGGGDETSFLYVLRFKGTTYGANATQYFTYSTLDPESGEEVVRTFDSNLFSGSNPYALRYKPSTNKDDRITSLPSVPDEVSGKYFNKAISGQAVKYDGGALTIGSNKFVVAKDSKITLVIKNHASTTSLLSDPKMDHEVYFNTQGVTVDSTLKDLLMTGTITGATKSSSSTVIDTLYITVDSVSADMGSATPGAYSAMSITVGDAATDATVTTAANVPAGYTLTASSSNTAAATVAVDGTTVKVTPVAAGTATITVTLTKIATNQTQTTTFTVTVSAAKTDAEVVTGAQTSVPAAITAAGGVGDTTVDLSSEATAKTAVKTAVTAALPAGVEVDTSDRTRAFDAGWEFGEFTPPTNGTEGSPNGTAGKFASVKVQIKKGEAKGLIEMTNVVVKAKAFDTPDAPTMDGTPTLSATTLSVANGASANTSITVTLPAATGYSSAIAFSSAADKGTDVATVSVTDSGSTGTISITPKAVGTGKYVVTVTQASNSATWTGTITVTVTARTAAGAPTVGTPSAITNDNGSAGASGTATASIPATGADNAGKIVIDVSGLSGTATNGDKFTVGLTAASDGSSLSAETITVTSDGTNWTASVNSITVTAEDGTTTSNIDVVVKTA